MMSNKNSALLFGFFVLVLLFLVSCDTTGRAFFPPELSSHIVAHYGSDPFAERFSVI